MNGQMRKFDYARYYRQLEDMPEPIMASQLPKVKLDLKGIRQYAREKGVSIANLTDAEKKLFIKA
ncbi:MAG: hypothetical protein NC092_01080 [Butyrivibrio sp.]|nr:hypothetical protein [Muribaculum sp.]MCM1551265.1 hypothetical protein [Butyrivibrio sp.]